MKPTLTFNLTRAQFEAKRAIAAGNGFTLRGDASRTPEYDLTILSYDYREPVLIITVEQHPPFLEGKVEAAINGFFA